MSGHTVEVLPHVRQKTYPFYIANIMGADALAPQGARASTTVILNMLNRTNLAPSSVRVRSKGDEPQWPLLLTWFNFNPSVDK